MQTTQIQLDAEVKTGLTRGEFTFQQLTSSRRVTVGKNVKIL